LSDVPNRHHTTGTDHIWSQGQMERDRMKHLKWHAKRVADETTAMVEALKLNRLVVGGPVEATGVFIQELPRRCQQMIAGTISVPVDIDRERLAVELRAIQEQAELQDEIKAVESMITAARKADRAVVGLADTLDAVNQGRVYRLVVDRGFRTEGKQCTACKVLLLGTEQTCAFCGDGLEPAPDLINRTSHKVLESSGKVLVVSGTAAQQLKEAGSIGAMLRF